MKEGHRQRQDGSMKYSFNKLKATDSIFPSLIIKFKQKVKLFIHYFVIPCVHKVCECGHVQGMAHLGGS